MFVIKFESWPRGITTAHEIGRCFVVPNSNGYDISIEYEGHKGNAPFSSSLKVETESTNIIEILTLAFQHSEK